MAGRNYRSSRDDDNESTTVTVYVGNLSYDTTQETLMEEFPGCVSVNIPTDRDSGKPRGFAFLEYKDKSAAQEAIQNDRMELDGRTLSINFAKPRGSSRGGGGGGRRGGGGYGGGGYGGDRGYRGGRGGDRGYRGGRGYGDDGGYGGGRDRGYGSSRGYGRERDDGYY